jgi:tetratricopeptide (TPR) repeat protein
MAELENLLLRAQELRERGDWGADATEVYERLVELLPEQPGPAVMLATCYEHAGRWSEARAAYERGASLKDKGRFEQRIKNGLRRARARERVARLDDFAQALRVARLAHETRGDLDLALVASARALELASSLEQETAAVACRADILRTAKKPDDALDLLRYAVKLDPSLETNLAVRTSLVGALLDAGRPREAQAEGERLMKAHPDDTSVARALGAVYARLHAETGDPRWKSASESAYARGGRRP